MGQIPDDSALLSRLSPEGTREPEAYGQVRLPLQFARKQEQSMVFI